MGYSLCQIRVCIRFSCASSYGLEHTPRLGSGQKLAADTAARHAQKGRCPMNARWNPLVTARPVGTSRGRRLAVYGALLLGLGAAASPVRAQTPSGRLLSWG